MSKTIETLECRRLRRKMTGHFFDGNFAFGEAHVCALLTEDRSICVSTGEDGDEIFRISEEEFKAATGKDAAWLDKSAGIEILFQNGSLEEVVDSSETDVWTFPVDGNNNHVKHYTPAQIAMNYSKITAYFADELPDGEICRGILYRRENQVSGSGKAVFDMVDIRALEKEEGIVLEIISSTMCTRAHDLKGDKIRLHFGQMLSLETWQEMDEDKITVFNMKADGEGLVIVPEKEESFSKDPENEFQKIRDSFVMYLCYANGEAYKAIRFGDIDNYRITDIFEDNVRIMEQRDHTGRQFLLKKDQFMNALFCVDDEESFLNSFEFPGVKCEIRLSEDEVFHEADVVDMDPISIWLRMIDSMGREVLHKIRWKELENAIQKAES